LTKIIFICLLLIFAILFFEYTSTNEYIQNFFYTCSSKEWIIDRNNQLLNFFFYDGAKRAIFIFGIILIIMLFLKKFNRYKKEILIVVASLIFVPVITGGLKKVTNMPCPKELKCYDGKYEQMELFKKNSPKITETFRCFPAGHASGGFALMSLAYVLRRKRDKYLALFGSLVVGWSMGLYKMMIGDHFLGHTVVTMLLAWLIIETIVLVANNKSSKVQT